MAKFAFVVDGEVGAVWRVSGDKDVEFRTSACLMSSPQIVMIDDEMIIEIGSTWDGEKFTPPAVN